MSEPDPNDTTGAQWESERQWLIDFMRQGLVMTSEPEKARVMAAMNRWETEVGDDLNRVVIHEAGHAVVAHALDWFVEYVEPQMPDGSGGAMTHQKRLEYSRLRSEWEQFLEQAAVA